MAPGGDDCVQCHRAFARGHFRVTKIKADGAEEGTIRVCSLICLIQWSYAYGARMGVRGVRGLQNVITQLAAGWQKLKG